MRIFQGGNREMTSFYEKSHASHLAKVKDLAPEQAQAFYKMDAEVFKDGALNKKEKEIIAVAIAHITECPYCIDVHTKNAKKEGATLEELAEAVFVAAALEAGGAVTHATHIQNALEKDTNYSLYERSNLKKIGELNKHAPVGFAGYSEFNTAAVKAGKLTVKLKEIIAVAVATATQCPYCIEVHAKKAAEAGATKEELSEAILVTAALRAGGAYAHMANMIESYHE